ncbi:hypothetical protein C7375_10797 [Frischella perrara]|uniref:YobI-like P-loop NTPase domain-containing protein n=1 Tax=Frischella perrara TaxID=1267021 RepID=A0A0A7S3L3_FRIPE|nr:hypothetical protein [Frischella perrara]AJA46013.1 hypothetical protein FPB0191_02209 [Frischella perrara]PWV61350.1 hypothetical protein C7375_10797 [Frischella perrara]
MEDNQIGARQPTNRDQRSLTFQKLTPITLSDDEMRGYNEALDFVFKEDDLLNIAISGPYASGKSSVFKTYEEKRLEKKKLKGIHISLSYFSPNLKSKIKNQNPDDELTFNDELMLERKIINQIIHQIEPKQIPSTDFKVKAESKSWINIFWASIISLFFCCFVYIDKTLLNKWLEEPTQLTLILIGSIFTLITFVFYKIIDLQHRKNLIRKLKIFQNEIDISSECDVSYFDKYLDEIIYILRKSKLDFIVFEDIDRYDDNLILNKLRELNYIYNQRQKNRKRKPTKGKTIKFIYLIKDEIFESKERTKFFDYILPIVPVMDNSNSLGKMEELFKNENIYSDFSITFLDTLSLYLDDIRLIKNICNEYIIYKKKLPHQASWFKKENLLAIIVYKNIFPEDYSLTRLGLGQGVVHRIIESLKQEKNTDNETETKIKELDEKIQLKKEKIKNLETDHLESIDELEALYILFPSEIYSYDYQFDDGTKISALTLNRVELISSLKENDYKINNGRRNSYYYREINCKQYFDALERDSEYKNRRKKLNIILQNKKSTLEQEIRELKKQKLQLKSPKKISEIIKLKQANNITIDNIFKAHINDQTEHEQYKSEYEKLSSSCYFPLLRTLIIQGYIDENYNDYTSLYDEQGLPQNDMLFLRNINERILNDWQLELKKPEIVLKRLNPNNSSKFNEPAVLNFSLLDHLLATGKTSYLSQFINLLTSHREINFIKQYFSRFYTLLINNNTKYQPEYLCLFVKQINIQLWNIWASIDKLDQRLYLYLSFIHNQPNELENMNEEVALKEFIEKQNDFLCIDEEWNRIFQLLDETENHLSKITDAFTILNIQFKQIEHSTPELLALVEANNRYKLNYVNVKHLLQNRYNQTNIDSQIIQTLLTLSDDAPVKVYFKRNPEPLVLSIAESDIQTIDDNEDIVLFILNHDEISLSVKIAYIDKISLTIKLLEQVTDKAVWNKLLENKKIEYSAENIVHYFFNYALEDEDEDKGIKINDQLAHFINNSDKDISPQQANLGNLISDEDGTDLFFKQIILNPDLNPDRYKMLIAWFNGKCCSNFNDIGVNEEKVSEENVSMLIQLKAIGLGEEQDLNFIRENYPKNIQELIIHNFNDYINKLKNNPSLVDPDEIISLLSEDLSLDEKLSLLPLTSKPILINNKNYPTELQNYILKNNFNLIDLHYITNSQFYDSTTDEIKETIKHLCIEYQEEILEYREISYDLLIELLKIEQFSRDNKYTLLCNQINQLNIEETYQAFKILEQDPTNESLFSNLFIGKDQYFDNTTLNKKMMKKLNQKWQLKYKIKEDKIIGYGQKLIKN